MNAARSRSRTGRNTTLSPLSMLGPSRTFPIAIVLLPALPILLAGPALMLGGQVDAPAHAGGRRAAPSGQRLPGLPPDGRSRPRRRPACGPVLPRPALRHRVRPHRAMGPDLRAGRRATPDSLVPQPRALHTA